MGQYEPLAERLGARYRQVDVSLWEQFAKMGVAKSINMRFIEYAIGLGQEFILASVERTGLYGEEIAYIMESGKYLDLGTKLVPIP